MMTNKAILAPDMPLSVQQTAHANEGKEVITIRKATRNLYNRLCII